MKRAVFLLLLALSLCGSAQAADTCQIPLTLCHTEAVTSFEYSFSVAEGTAVSTVQLALPDSALRDWNFMESSRTLHIAAAPSEAIDLTDPVAMVTADDPEALTLTRLRVNGKTVAEPKTAHTPQTVPGTPPSCESPGLTDGLACAVCGSLLQDHETIPPTGPVVSAALDGDGTLHVTGAFSDAEEAAGPLWAAVYAASGQLLDAVVPAAAAPNRITFSIPTCQDAALVRLFYLGSGHKPLTEAIFAAVSQP